MSRGARREGERRTVLLVDDAPDNRAMYAEFLALEGYRVLEADNGVQAVATARAEVPDAIVMDVGLPAIDGIEAARILRSEERTKHVVILAISGHGREIEERAADAGVDGYVRKPCLPMDLSARLRALLASRAGR